MELDAFNGKGPVADAHDNVVGGVGTDGEIRGKFCWIDDQGVVAHRWERITQRPEDSLGIVLNLRKLAVHDRGSANNLTAERRADCLVPEANTQERDLGAKAADGRA